MTTRIIALLFICTSAAFAADPPAEAKALFDRFVALGREFDPALADLYVDEAKIENTRTYPTGQKRKLELSGAQYKALIRGAMPLAKARGDTNRFSDVKYAIEGDRVRITSTRYSELKDYSSPFSLLVGPSEGGKWLIYEEIGESQP